MGLALRMYAQDYDERNVYTAISGPVLGGNGMWWMITIQPYLKNIQLLNCPSYPGGGYCANTGGGCETSKQPAPTPYRYFAGYGMNNQASGWTDSSVAKPAETFVVMDGACVITQAPPNWPMDTAGNIANALRHNSGANVAYFDGHVKWLNQQGFGVAGANWPGQWLQTGP